MLWSKQRIAALGLALSLALTLVACGSGEGRQAEYLSRAQQHFDAGNLEKARLDVKNVLQINSNNVDAHYLMALIAEQEQDWRGAFGQLNFVVEKDPGHVDAVVKLAQLTLLSNDMEKARERVEIALELAPNDPLALAVMAAVKLRDEQADEAESYANKALEIDPGQVPAIGVLIAIYGPENPAQALQIIDEGLVANPENLTLHTLKIRFLDILGRTDEVVAELQLLIKLHPENTVYVGNLSDYYFKNLRADESEDLLRQSIAANPEVTEFKVYLVRVLAAHRGEEAALAELEMMLKQEPENFRIREILAGSLAKNGDTERAEVVIKGAFDFDVSGADSQAARNFLTALARSQNDSETAKRWIDEALEVEPGNLEALLHKASISLSEGDYRRAIPELRMVLRGDPNSVPALLMLADAQQKDRSLNLALDNYRSVLELQPNNVVALYQSAKIMAGQQNYDSAIGNLENLLELQPDNIEAINLLIGVYSQQGQWDEANSQLEAISADDNARGVADLLGASLEMRQGNYERALQLANSALEKNSELVAAVPIGARAYAAGGDIGAAIDFVEPYLERFPNDASLYDIQAQLYFSSKEPDKAAEMLKQSLAVAPERIATYISLARVYFSQGSLKEIEELYVRGIKANPSNTTLRAELAIRYQAGGEYQLALDMLEEAYELDAGSLIIANNLSALLMDFFPSEENLRRVQKLTLDFESAGNPALLDTLGWLHYHLGNIPRAISLLESAQGGGGQGVDYWYHLGMAYAKNGQLDLAREQLAKVLADETANFQGRAKAQEAYDNL